MIREQDKMQELVKLALQMREYSYAPYSHFRVGAALLTQEGEIYTGCNIENSAFTPTNCAERTAFFKAVSEGRKEFEAIAICGGKESVIEGLFPPCGVCRQVMREFCGDDFLVYLAAKDGIETYTLKELLPVSFRPEMVEK